jgi:DNA-binding CsgD family transcriptional regulator
VLVAARASGCRFSDLVSALSSEVTRHVLQGSSTGQIAAELVLSPHTIQQHLKAIFDKTGVRSRRDLVGRIYFAHYEPRVRDNEDRAAGGLPLRGEPMIKSVQS